MYGGLTMLSVTSAKSDKRQSLNMRKCNIRKTSLKCEERSLNIVKTGTN